jgi:hypothetical protein
MIESLEEIKEYIERCSEEDRQALKQYLVTHSPHPLETEWGIDGHTILSAISRASDLTRRGMRGIIAEAVFETEVLRDIAATGWRPEKLEGDLSYDVKLAKDKKIARIQIKLQRLEAGVPKLYMPKKYSGRTLYVVEVQRTRSGNKRLKTVTVEPEPATLASTRPYEFADFDILAVNMHPSSGQWNDFRYCLGANLLPRKNQPTLIEVLQPVADVPDEAWTDSLPQCLSWYEEAKRASILPEGSGSTPGMMKPLDVPS